MSKYIFINTLLALRSKIRSFLARRSIVFAVLVLNRFLLRLACVLNRSRRCRCRVIRGSISKCGG
jgi:hypothetical protein